MIHIVWMLVANWKSWLHGMGGGLRGQGVGGRGPTHYYRKAILWPPTFLQKKRNYKVEISKCREALALWALLYLGPLHQITCIHQWFAVLPISIVEDSDSLLNKNSGSVMSQFWLKWYLSNWGTSVSLKRSIVAAMVGAGTFYTTPQAHPPDYIPSEEFELTA